MRTCLTTQQNTSRSLKQLKIGKRNDASHLSETSFSVEVVGFEPTAFWSRTKRATKLRYTSKRANRGTRTLDLRFTKPLLYRLSHVGTLTKSALSVYHESTKKSRANFMFSEILVGVQYILDKEKKRVEG